MQLLNMTYDDRLTDVLQYVGSWTNNGSYNASNVGESGTLSFTKDSTARVIFTFPVPANAFYYYGVRRCCGGVYQICIDCDDPDSFNVEKVDAVNETDDGKNPPVVLFSKSFDKPEVHTITLVNHHDKRFGGNSELTLDRFVLQVETPVFALSGSSSISATSLIVPEASQPNTTSSPTSGPPIGVIGGVLGGIVAISLCLIIWFFIRRHHTQRTNMHTPTAYTVMAATSDYTSRKTDRASVVAALSASNASPGRIHPSSRMVSRERLPRHEIDAGRVDVDDGDFGTLPPQYEVVFSDGRLHSERTVTRGPSRRLSRHEPQRPLPLEGGPFGASGQPSTQPTKLLSH
ncbi:hypothetical protein EV421DRAFT_1794469 [Armillaria borealis]|uniref:Uncharacterized protein n=1 Tax=Armillaria borealis TaxID=47425 RepID=A0AA39MT72_9AGAR|nr:hypothetical protein EV421DRAFT_1794469 [Armillaria borealis]